MLKGIDVSKWQSAMNWARAKSAGAHFAFIRAGSINYTTGTCYTDSQFERNADEAPDHMPVGFYFYFRPNHSADKQADYFWNLVRDKEWFGLVADCEARGGTNTEIRKATYSFTERVAEMCLDEYAHSIIYSRSSYWNPFIGQTGWAKQHDLWIARYAMLSHPWGDGKYKPLGWDDWKFWQFSDRGSGYTYGAQSQSIDLNYFNGDEDDLKKYINGEHEVVYEAAINVPQNADRIILHINRTL